MGRPGAALVAILAAALAIRMMVVLVTPDYTPLFDAVEYQHHAVSLADGHGFAPSTVTPLDRRTAFRPPLYPLMLAVVYTVFKAGPDVGRALGAVLGVLTVLLIYLVALQLWGRTVALVAGGLAAVYPSLAMLNAALLTESPFLAIEVALVLAVLRYRSSRHPGWAALAGVLCGLAALTRSNGLLLAIPALLGVLGPGRPALGRRALVGPAVVIVGAVVAIAPWTIRNAMVFHAFVPLTTQTGFGIAGTYNDEARVVDGYKSVWQLTTRTREYGPIYTTPGIDEVRADAQVRRRALDFARRDPGYVAQTTGLSVLRTVELAGLPPGGSKADRIQRGLVVSTASLARWTFYVAVLLGLWGAVCLARRPRGERSPPFMWLVPLLTWAAAVWVLGLPRYRITLEPFVIMLAAVAIVDLAQRVRPRPAP